ncbi:hypothetical protein G6011_02928 [Alternaria panax]|uniref:Uncharacterized protein n=1 Tax=Alternaria panax TaxID=48097 RepID=A0AAD4I5R2_9PLEO|nr:hypothetical protein G6011_02928 [Alternaria panax]
MPPNDSKHHLPVSSILFNNKTYSTAHPRNHVLAHPTLADLHDAQDTTVTALPQPPTSATSIAKPNKDGFCKRILARIKVMLRLEHEVKEVKGQDEKVRGGVCIGEPTNFKHLGTAGPRPMRDSVPAVVEEESGWEDVGESEAGRNTVRRRR